jgi:hypothetical protein
VPSITGDHVAVAEDEREAISGRTKTAPASAKYAPGHQQTPPIIRRRMSEARTAPAAQFAANVQPIVRGVQADDHELQRRRRQLNAYSVATANGG